MTEAGPSKRAWAVQWRNFQGKKNKTWESDGILLAEGLGVTIYSDDGKLLGAKHLSRPVEEDLELSLAGKDFKVGEMTTLSHFHQVVGSRRGETAPAAVPAKPIPGCLSRGQSSANTPRMNERPTTPAPGRSAMFAPTSSADTPSSANKSWTQPGAKAYKPFKRPTIVDSPVVRAAPVAPRSLQKPPTPLQQPQQTSLPRAVASATRDIKGKSRAVASDATPEVENTAPRSSPERQTSKRRRLNSAEVAPPCRTSSVGRKFAADAAFEKALSRNSDSGTPSARDGMRAPPVRVRSAPTARSPTSASRTGSTDRSLSGQPDDELDDEMEEEEEPISWNDVELDAKVFDFPAEKEGEDDDDEEDIGRELGSAREDAQKAKKSLAASSQADEAQANPTRQVFDCVWRKATTAKNAKWAGDARLTITGRSGRLVDTASGKVLAQGNLPSGVEMTEEAVFVLRGITIQVGDPVAASSSYRAQLSTKKKTPAQPVSATTSRTPAFRPPAPAKAVNPLARQVAARSVSPALERSPVPRQSSVAATGTFKLPKLSTEISSLRAPAAPRNGPLHDPDREGALVMLRPDAAHRAEYNKRNAPIVDVVVDPLIGDKLRAHQREGVKFLYECVMGMRSSGQGCILADDMGLGKTIQAIALVWTLLKQSPYPNGQHGEIKRAMIVCPVTLVKNWKKEFNRWIGKTRINVLVAESKQDIDTFAYSKAYEVLIIGYEKVRDCVDQLKAAQPPVGLVICDEGHRLKSDKTKTSQALQSLSCMRRVILSGTPIQNNLGEFFAMMDFVNPGILRDAAYFKKNFEVPIMAARQPNASSKVRKEGADALETLTDIQNHFLLRRTNEVILEHLPPKWEYTVFVRPTRLQLAVYHLALSNSAVKSVIEGRDIKSGLALLQHLLKLATSPGLLLQHIKEKGLGDLDESILDAFPPEVEPADFALSGKLTVLGNMLEELRAVGEEKIVVVSNFTTTLDLIETHCKRHKYPYQRLDGKTPQQDRIAMVDAFNNEPSTRQFVFLLSSKSGGTGLNIIGASRLVQIDSDWNPSNDLQAMARIHREGQKRECYIYRFLTSGTVDEVIYQRQLTKLALSGSIIEKEGGGGAKNKNAFTADELRNLFTLHADVACQTHDLLGCRCHLGEETRNDDADGSDGDSADEDKSGSDVESDAGGAFIAASQFRSDDAQQKLTYKRRNLSVLKTWAHYDARKAAMVESIEDLLLQALLFRGLCPKRASDDDDAEAEDEDGLPPLSEEDLPLRGGQIAFLFGKRSAAP